jgi:hypothetical protein
MRPRITFSLALLTSILALGSLILMADSYFHSLGIRTEQWQLGFSFNFLSEEGSASLALYIEDDYQTTDESTWEVDHDSISDFRPNTIWSQVQWMSFGYTWMEEGQGTYYNDIRFPLWIWPPIWGLLAALSWRRWVVVRRRLRPGCNACGYDLTGNTSGQCPECGGVAAISHDARTQTEAVSV